MPKLFTRFREMFIPPDWVRNGEVSAKGSELRYWTETGLSKGDRIYDRYLELFGLLPGDFNDQVVADFGVGPLGGVLGALVGIKIGYPIDVLADEYNRMRQSPFPIVLFQDGRSAIPSSSCDVVFCTNMIDHTPYPEMVANEILRILKPGGKAFIHLHLRKRYELNKVHPFPWSKRKFRSTFKSFCIVTLETEFPDWVNGNQLEMLWACCEKPG